MHDLCIFLICFCSKIIFNQKIFSLFWDKLDYPGSIVYLSCFDFFVQKSFLTKNYFFTAEINLTTRVHCILVFFLPESKRDSSIILLFCSILSICLLILCGILSINYSSPLFGLCACVPEIVAKFLFFWWNDI